MRKELNLLDIYQCEKASFRFRVSAYSEINPDKNYKNGGIIRDNTRNKWVLNKEYSHTLKDTSDMTSIQQLIFGVKLFNNIVEGKGSKGWGTAKDQFDHLVDLFYGISSELIIANYWLARSVLHFQAEYSIVEIARGERMSNHAIAVSLLQQALAAFDKQQVSIRLQEELDESLKPLEISVQSILTEARVLLGKLQPKQPVPVQLKAQLNQEQPDVTILQHLYQIYSAAYLESNNDRDLFEALVYFVVTCAFQSDRSIQENPLYRYLTSDVSVHLQMLVASIPESLSTLSEKENFVRNYLAIYRVYLNLFRQAENTDRDQVEHRREFILFCHRLNDGMVRQTMLYSSIEELAQPRRRAFFNNVDGYHRSLTKALEVWSLFNGEQHFMRAFQLFFNCCQQYGFKSPGTFLHSVYSANMSAIAALQRESKKSIQSSDDLSHEFVMLKDGDDEVKVTVMNAMMAPQMDMAQLNDVAMRHPMIYAGVVSALVENRFFSLQDQRCLDMLRIGHQQLSANRDALATEVGAEMFAKLSKFIGVQFVQYDNATPMAFPSYQQK